MTEQAPRRRPGPRLIPVARIAGVPLVISPFWIIIAVLYVAAFAPNLRHDAAMSSTTSYVIATVIVLAVYASVLVHEAGHVLVARALGLRVGRVVLQVLGGTSEILDEPQDPGQEFLVSAIGPLTSILLVGVMAGLLPLTTPHTDPWLIVVWTLWSNALIAIFNLLPGLPLDGGRIARAVVWRITGDKVKGTLAAGWVGRVIAFGIIAVGIGTAAFDKDTSGFAAGSLYLLLVALFIAYNANHAIAQARVSRALPKLSIAPLLRKAMPVEAQLPVAEAVRRAQIAQARALVVVDGYGKPQGLVSESAVMALPEQRRPWTSVSDLSRPLSGDLILREGISGDSLLRALANNATEYLVVAETGAIRGVLSRADLGPALRAAGVMA